MLASFVIKTCVVAGGALVSGGMSNDECHLFVCLDAGENVLKSAEFVGGAANDLAIRIAVQFRHAIA